MNTLHKRRQEVRRSDPGLLVFFGLLIINCQRQCPVDWNQLPIECQQIVLIWAVPERTQQSTCHSQLQSPNQPAVSPYHNQVDKGAPQQQRKETW